MDKIPPLARVMSWDVSVIAGEMWSSRGYVRGDWFRFLGVLGGYWYLESVVDGWREEGHKDRFERGSVCIPRYTSP